MSAQGLRGGDNKVIMTCKDGDSDGCLSQGLTWEVEMSAETAISKTGGNTHIFYFLCLSRKKRPSRVNLFQE